MRRRALAAIALAALALAGCGRADFEDQGVSAEQVRAALTEEGVEVCRTTEVDARTPGASEETRLDVALECADPEGSEAVLVISTFEEADDRDAAAQRFEIQVRPAAQGAVWTLGASLVRVSGDRDPEVVDRITAALDGLGAQ